MFVEKSSPEPLDEINERLTTGIETCRSVVANYKSLLSGEQVASPSDESDDTGVNSDPPSAND